MYRYIQSEDVYGFCFCMYLCISNLICLGWQAGKHAALAPVNTDVQARQIAAAYIEDTEDVAVAKV